MPDELKKELVLINPPVESCLLRAANLLQHGSYTPLSLHVLAALTPKEYKITFINPGFFWLGKNFVRGVLVGITCVTSSAPIAYKIADYCRRAGAFVVLGGFHVSVLPEEALRHGHSVVIGEAESVWPEVVKDFEAGSLKRMYQGEPLKDFFSPVYEYFLRLPPKQLRRVGIPLQRGCGFRCEFCAMPATKRRLDFVKIEQVVTLVKKATQDQPPGSALMLIGDNVYSDPGYAKKLFLALQGLGVSWFAGSSLDIAFDDEVLTLARKSGCRFLMIGFESIYPQQMAKTSVHQMRSDRDYARAIDRIKSHGLPVIGLFIAGFDNYSHIDYLRLLRFLARPMRFFFASVNILTPFPGSVLYERFCKEGRLRKAGWGAYTLLRVLFRPARLSRYSLMFWFLATKLTAAFMSTVGLVSLLIFVLFSMILMSSYNLSYKLFYGIFSHH